MATNSIISTKVATLALPTREAHVTATVWPGPSGMLLFLAELNLAPPTRQQFLQNINAEIEKSWQEAKLLSDTADQVLERVVRAANTTLTASERLLGNPLTPRYQLLMGYLNQRQAALSNIGHMNAFVISETRLVNILSNTGKKKAKPGGVFDHIASGELAIGETLLLATPALTDYFSWERLKQLVGERPPGLSLREIERYMLQLKVHPPLGLICLQLAPSRDIEGTGPSLDHLLQTKAQTTSLLEPKLFSHLKTYVKNKLAGQKNAANSSNLPALKPQPDKQQPTNEPETVRRPSRGLTASASKLVQILKKLSWLKSRQTTKDMVAWWLEAKKQSWLNLPHHKKIILALGIIIIFAFSQSIVNMGRAKLKAADSEIYNEMVTLITEKQAAIEAALIYGDDTKAASLYEETAALINNIPNNSRTRQAQKIKLESSLLQLAKRLQRLTEVTSPPLFLTLPPEIQTWQNLAFMGESLFVGSPTSLLEVNRRGQIIRNKVLPAGFTLQRVFKLDGELLLLGQDKQAVVYNITSGRQSQIELNFSPVDASYYRGGLYYLSQENRTIYRAGRQGAGFASPMLWLRASQGERPLANGLTVDGNIYLVQPTKIEKFSRGQMVEFTLGKIDPPLTNASYLYTLNETDYLYVWENTINRLVVLDKAGKLVTQLTFPSLQIIKAVAVDGQNKVIYLLSAGQIYKVALFTPVE